MKTTIHTYRVFLRGHRVQSPSTEKNMTEGGLSCHVRGGMSCINMGWLVRGEEQDTRVLAEKSRTGKIQREKEEADRYT